MKREILKHQAVVEGVDVSTLVDVRAWLEAQAATYHTYQLMWLLAHADDGVIWGKLKDNRIITSHEATQGNGHARPVYPTLRLETLQQARLFSESAELLLWRDGDNTWQARLIRDAHPDEKTEWDEAIDEEHLLWGTHPDPLNDDFTLMTDGAQGLAHAVPLNISGRFSEEARPLRLAMRHYVKEDITGFVRIVASRLRGVRAETKQGGAS